MGHYDLLLHAVAANLVGLHQHHPSRRPGSRQTRDVVDRFVRRDSVLLGQGDQTQTGPTEQGRYLQPPQAAVQEQLRQPGTASGPEST